MTGSDLANAAVEQTLRYLKIAFTVIFATALAGGGALISYVALVTRPAPIAQPSVPSLIPPPLSCLCGTTRAIIRPLNVTCPYCRNTFPVQPSGQTGQVVGDVVKPATK